MNKNLDVMEYIDKKKQIMNMKSLYKNENDEELIK
jgi:hypothetical protein